MVCEAELRFGCAGKSYVLLNGQRPAYMNVQSLTESWILVCFLLLVDDSWFKIEMSVLLVEKSRGRLRMFFMFEERIVYLFVFFQCV